MLSMATHPDQLDSDARFGRNVALFRGFADLTQKALAERLAERGMAVDASAVSRIEKGTRAVRLSEAMLIADALNVELEQLVGGIRTPMQEFNRIRGLTNTAMHLARQPMLDWAENLSWVSQHARENPELIEKIEPDAELGRPVNADVYLLWIRERVRLVQHRWKRLESSEPVWVSDESEAQQIVGVFAEFARGLLVTGEEEIAYQEARNSSKDEEDDGTEVWHPSRGTTAQVDDANMIVYIKGENAETQNADR